MVRISLVTPYIFDIILYNMQGSQIGEGKSGWRSSATPDRDDMRVQVPPLLQYGPIV